MFVIVGLGNPGKEYERTRHNMGFMTLDALASRSGIQISRHHFRAYFGEGFLGAKKVVLAKPNTFMNNSGYAVRDLVNWYKITPEELILIYDDADIPEGFIRVREGGSAGTHNGMRSVIYQLGFDDFPRVRIGIGSAQYNMIQHVLTMPQGESAVLLQKAILDAADAVELIVAGELHEAQARFNRKPPKARKADSEENENDEPAEPRA